MCTVATILITPVTLHAADDSQLAAGIIEIQQFVASNNHRDALNLLRASREQYPRNLTLMELEAQVLFDMGRWVDARTSITSSRLQSETLSDISNAITKQLTKAASSDKRATIMIQRRIDVDDFRTAIAIAELALGKYPDKRVNFHLLKGEALYKSGDLDAAEIELRKTLRTDPMNDVARAYIEEIRDTQQAQTSTAVAEWISIAKDKVGDFIVTFLALFAAFLVNSGIEPILLRVKLNKARKSFEDGNYDEFTDLIEGLLDEENFSILRANFRIVLNQKGYTEAKSILEGHVVTLERLPTLLRILEREYEKMSEAT
jgi:tetratricopeptide (TPR) repeat protein